MNQDEAGEYLKEVHDRLIKSAKYRLFLQEMSAFGGSTINIEEIIKEILNEPQSND